MTSASKVETTARAVRFHKFGGPEVLRVEAIKIGEPGPDEVRIAVAAIGLNRVETIYLQGGFGPVRFPATIGYEAAGIIEAVGSGVTHLAHGDHVVVLYGLAMEQFGTCADRIIYPADRVVKLPRDISLIEAAASWMQYGTAYGLVEIADIQPGDHVVITAASSSVGIAAIQIANAHGAIPIATTRTSAKKQRLAALGAAHVIVTDVEDVAEEVLAMTGGKGARIIFDAIGGPNLAELTPAMAREGIAIVYGLFGGIAMEVPLAPFMQANLTVRGWSADVVTADPARRARLVEYLLPRLESGELRPEIARTFALDDVTQAYAYMESNQQIGKIVVISRPDLAG
ncbi:zinc-dependent alcohol dehydrogenase family protein [Novosphingobium malaysiense]|uniref:Enoyl reductase (ER) domain-containing protein n=1 Tax=Novosphingobium malaysiense TaxID=1348853 RepID=A0A0B1ZLU3_9SPHN|nr:zinc-dependent alcohol dehydrogenase family protein [Novosphingobium malaysiense]KHK90255.1 hypothetical protein LK12_16565 [Novosphingobium malaysiense]